MHASFWQWLTNAIHRGKLTSPFLLSKQLLTEHFTKRLLKVKAIVLLQVNLCLQGASPGHSSGRHLHLLTQDSGRFGSGLLSNLKK